MNSRVNNLIILTGMSGAGISSASRAIEDQNIRVVSNPPTNLLIDIFQSPTSKSSKYEEGTLALAIQLNSKDDAKGLIDFIKHINILSPNTKVDVWFLTANNEVLLNRFRRQRRPHPLENLNADENDIILSIDSQRKTTAGVLDISTWVVDTSNISESDLRLKIIDQINALLSKSHKFYIDVYSFGIEHDRQLPLDFLFNCRDLPNPYWDEKLKKMNGLDKQVSDYVLNHASSQQYLSNIENLIWNGIALAINTSRVAITFGFGCTGGQHRSVAVAEEISKRLKEDNKLLDNPEYEFMVTTTHLAKKGW